MSNQLPEHAGYHLHYSVMSQFVSGDIYLYQSILAPMRINVLDIVLLAHQCLSVDSGLEFSEEFFNFCFEPPRLSIPAKEQYRAANLVYIGVKSNIKSKIGLDPVTEQLRKFKLVNYVFGPNKQSLSTFIQPV